jgi:hypothetical protein
LRLCPQSGFISKWRRQTTSFYYISFTEVHSNKDQLWDSWQRISSHCRLILRMEIFSWRNCPFNYSLYQPQEPWVFHVRFDIKLTSSSLEYIINFASTLWSAITLDSNRVNPMLCNDVYILHIKKEMLHMILNILFLWSPSDYFLEPCIQ